MSNEELKYLFIKYLEREPTLDEIKFHGNKSINSFELELDSCRERQNLLKRKTNKTSGKIALLLSGHIRGNSILKSLLIYLNKTDYDVFVYCWDNIGQKGKETNLNDKTVKSNIEFNIQKIPNLRSYIIDNNKTFIEGISDDVEYFNFSSPEKFLKSQLYTINKCYELMEKYSNENNIKYDLVIRSRFDLEITKFDITKKTINDLNDHNIIFVPNSDSKHGHTDYGSSCWACDNMYYKFGLKEPHIFEHTNIICDLFAYGSMKSMKEYCNLYNNFDKLNESFNEENKKMIEKLKIKYEKVGNVYKLPQNRDGHINSLYYVYCSYPERLLQKHLREYMLLESKEIKIKFNR